MERDLRKAKPHVRRDWRPLAAEGARHAACAALGAFAASAELVFGVHPFGAALVAAAPWPYLAAAAAGGALWSLFTGSWLSLVTLALAVVLRLTAQWLLEKPAERAPLFCERPLFRVAAAAVAVFAAGLYTVIRNGYLYYHLFGVILASLAAPLAAFLYIGMFAPPDKPFPHSREAGFGAAVLTAVFALREVSFAGLYPAAIAAALAAFWLVAHRDMIWGAIGGALAGLCFDPALAPAFLLCALAFGLLEKSSRGGGILAASAAASAWGFFMRGTDGVYLLLPALLAAGALFLAADSAGIVEGSPARRAALAHRRAAAQSAKAGAQAANETQLRELSGAFLDLSGKFYELGSKLRRPALRELRHLCDKTFDGVCPTCRHRDVCWGSEYGVTAETLEALAARLHTRGSVTAAQFPAALATRCPETARLVAAINAGAARLAEEALRGDKTSVVAMDYAAMGRLLSETLDAGNEDFACDEAAGARIFERLRRLGFSLESAAVCGKKHRRVILRGVRLPGERLKLRELRRILEQHCHFPLGDPAVTAAEGVTDVTFPERTRFQTQTVRLTRPKSAGTGKDKGENRYCGDSVMTVSSPQGYDYAFLCDGMGSGNLAALTSALAATFLSRLLRAGNRAETSLKMLNGFLAARGVRDAEASATVDLLEVDCVSGEAALFKCGAAPSFLLRSGEVTHFFSRTVPVGIFETLDAERIRFDLQAGDVLVQVSDGVTGSEEDCEWLTELLRTGFDGNAEEFARTVLAKAGKESRDDLSVLITTVRAADGAQSAAPAAA